MRLRINGLQAGLVFILFALCAFSQPANAQEIAWGVHFAATGADATGGSVCQNFTFSFSEDDSGNPNYMQAGAAYAAACTPSATLVCGGIVTSDGGGCSCSSPGFATDGFELIAGSGIDATNASFCLRYSPNKAEPFPSNTNSKSEGDNQDKKGCGCTGNQALESTPGTTGGSKTGEPIDIGSGNVFFKYTDYQSSGANQLSFTRYYNSLAGANSNTYAVSLGLNWRSTYDRYLNIVSSTSATAERADGQVLSFTYNGTVWASDTDVDMTLTQTGSGMGSTWTLKDHDDNVESYTQLATGEALLQSITTRNGYVQTLTYNGNNQLTTVTDSFGRTITLTYYTDTADAGLINTVTTPDGLAITYDFQPAISGLGFNDQLATIHYSDNSPEQQINSYTKNFFLNGVSYEDGSQDGWTYDNEGRGTSSFSGQQGEGDGGLGNGANFIQIAYNDTDGSRTVTNSLGETDTYTFTTLQNIPKVTQISRAATSTVAAATETFTYDSNGYMASKTDWNGNVTHYVNNSHGDPTSITEAYGTAQARTTTIAYDTTFVHLPDTITAPRKTTTFTYDSNGNTLTRTQTDTTGGTTNGEIRTWTYTYDSFGHVLVARGPTQGGIVRKTTYAYYSGTNNINTVTDALSHVSTITSYDNSGHPLSMTDPNGVVTTFTYNPRGFIQTSTVHLSSGNATTQYQYDTTGRQLQGIILADSSGLFYNYDAADRVIEVSDSVGSGHIDYTLDANGDITQQQIPGSGHSIDKTQTAVFDSLGRMLQQIGAASQTTTYGYDGNGNALTIEDPLSSTTTRAFDPLNRLISSIDPLTHTTAFAYDTQDNTASVTDPRSLATSYTYNAFGEVLTETSPDRGTTTYTYDKNRNLLTRTDARSDTITYTYDALNRVLTATNSSDTSQNVTYTYDASSGSNFGIGRLASFTDGSGSTTYTYDQLGDILTDTRVINGITYTATYTYNKAGRVMSITYPSSDAMAYTRDADGRITKALVNPGITDLALASSVTYLPFGPVASFTYGNGVTATLAYDEDYRLTGITSTGDSGNIQGLTLAYDNASDITGITDSVDSTRNQTFAYDADYRLLTASGKYGSDAFTYDADGNRLTSSEGGVSSAYTYPSTSNLASKVATGGLNRYLNYNQTGDITTDSRYNPGVANLKYGYDKFDRLQTVQTNDILTATYTYNALNQRVMKTIAGVAVTVYSYDLQGHLIGEADGTTGAPLRDYVYLNDMPLAQIENTGIIYYYHPDQLGTPQKMTDPDQNVAFDRVQHPFGETYSQTGVENSNIRFPGQYADGESLLNQNWNRYYDPSLGGYTQVDRIGLAGGINPLVYVGGNPVNWSDPSGLDTYIINRNLAAASLILGPSSQSRLNPITHTFVAITNPDGTVAETYSWGNDANLQGWNTNQRLDFQAAKQAINNGSAEKVGDSTLDPFVTQEFNMLNNPQNEHQNLIIADNCKTETDKLIEGAKIRQSFNNSANLFTSLFNTNQSQSFANGR